MARTIGVKNKNLLKRLVKEARNKDIHSDYAIFEYVKERLDSSVFDTWEMAYSEIENLVSEYNHNN